MRLLRNALDDHFGQLTLLAPTIVSTGENNLNSTLDRDEGGWNRFDPSAENIRIEPAFTHQNMPHLANTDHHADWRTALRTFTQRGCVLQAEIHATSDSVIANETLQAKGIATPIVLVHSDESSWGPDKSSWRQSVETRKPVACPHVAPHPFERRQFRRRCERLAKHAELSLFSSEDSLRQYSKFAHNPRFFYEPTLCNADVISETELLKRLQGDRPEQPLRLVCYAPLEPKYGVNFSIAIIRYARNLGANIRLDLYGRGVQRSELQYQIAKLGLTNVVQFQDSRSDHVESVPRPFQYDAVLLTPIVNCNIQPFLSCYSSGLPILGFDQASIQSRLAEDQTGVILPKNDLERSGRRLAELELQRGQLVEISLNARRAASKYSLESWYAQRAEWTFHAISRPRMRTPSSDAAPRTTSVPPGHPTIGAISGPRI